jgi:hypothetical protein
MKKRQFISLLVVLGAVLIYQPAVAADDMVFFDSNGDRLDQAQYQQYVSERGKTIGMELQDGYGLRADAGTDPIKLRKRRIEQWKKMRSHYNPGSLPHKIEKPREE